jgi:hypothetical protein
MSGYLLGLLTALSQLLNAAIGGCPRETLSHRAARNQHLPVWRAVGLVLEAVHPGHLAWALDRQRPGTTGPALSPRDLPLRGRQA